MGDIMKILIHRASLNGLKSSLPPCKNAEWDEKEHEWYIEINTISDIIELSQELKEDLIFQYYSKEHAKRYNTIIDILI